MHRKGLLAAAVIAAVYVGCKAGSESVFTRGKGPPAAEDGGGGDLGAGGMGGSEFDPTSGSGAGEGTTCNNPGFDYDMDGLDDTEGDCNDCDPNVNPNAVEVILDSYGSGGGSGSGGAGGASAEPADEDCDGEIDEPPDVCDTALPIDSQDPFDAARAVGLCKISGGPDDWGVVNAQWVAVDGTPAPASPNFHLGHGNLDHFGSAVNPQQGGKMLALSSGTARNPTDTGYMSVGGFDKGYTMNHPQGFPKESPACPFVTTGIPHDGAAVQITIKAPSNAQGFSFDFDFYTYEWPGFVCSTYNDFFVAILDPIPMGQLDGNISFDQLGNPVSVNNAFLEVCGCSGGPPCLAGGKTFNCALGNAELQGTGFTDGFQDHGATSWLVTQAPVEPNATITIRWGVYDSGDGVLDSTTLIDNWEWVAEPGTVVGTEPVPDPQ
jgi:hypothetical protein